MIRQTFEQPWIALFSARSTQDAEREKAQLGARCLLTVFYEWQTTPTGKQPYRFTLKDESLFFFAGLWELWRNPEGKDARTVTLITIEPNAVTQPVRDRMPVILTPENQDKWLSQDTPVEELRSLLVPYPAEEMKATPVSTAGKSANYNAPELVAPFASAGEFRLEG